MQTTKDSFIEACNKGDFEKVKEILNSCPAAELLDIAANRNPNTGETALHVACSGDHFDIVELIYAKLEENDFAELIKERDSHNRTMVHTVFSLGCKKILSFLKKNIPRRLLVELMDMEDDTNKTPLESVLKYRQFDILGDFLTELSGTPEYDKFAKLLQPDTLIEACKYGDSEAVIEILKSDNRKFNFIERLVYPYDIGPDDNGTSVLHIACERGDQQLVKETCAYLWRLHTESLYYRQQKTYDDILKNIICRPDKVSKTILYTICQLHYVQLFKLVLNLASKFNCLSNLLMHTDSDHVNILWYALQLGHDGMMEDVLIKSHEVGCIKPVLLCRHNNKKTMIQRAYRKHSFHIPCLKLLTNYASEFNLPQELLRIFFFDTEQTEADKRKSAMQYIPHENRAALQYLLSPFCETKRATGAQNNESGSTSTEGTQSSVIGSKPSDFPILHSDTVLDVIVESECEELINHTYVKDYLAACWRTHGRYFLCANLLVYFFLLVSLTLYATSHQFDIVVTNSTNGQTAYKETFPVLKVVTRYSLLIFGSLSFLYEVWQMAAKRISYLRCLDNYVDLFICLSSFVLSTASIMYEYNSWMHQLAVVVMLTAWINGAWMTTKLGFINKGIREISQMFIMLFSVMRSVCLYVPVLAVLNVAIGFAFFCLLQNQMDFHDLGFVIMKSMAMTVGDFSIGDIFFPETDIEQPPFFALTSIIFVIFLIIMNISVMNLLIGVAVGDTGKLMSQSDVLAFKHYVDFTREVRAMIDIFPLLKSKSKPTYDHCHQSSRLMNEAVEDTEC